MDASAGPIETMSISITTRILLLMTNIFNNQSFISLNYILFVILTVKAEKGIKVKITYPGTITSLTFIPFLNANTHLKKISLNKS